MLKPRLSKEVMENGVLVQTHIDAELHYWLKKHEPNLKGFIRQKLKELTIAHRRNPVDLKLTDAPDKLTSERVYGLMFYPDWQYWNDELRMPISAVIRTVLVGYYNQKMEKKPINKLSQAEIDEIDAELETQLEGKK